MTLQINIDVIVHATEDERRISESLIKCLQVDPSLLRPHRSEGHYGNVITVLGASVRRAGAHMVLERLRGSLSDADIENMWDTLDARVDGSTLYMRLDKQDMVTGVVRLSDSGAVRIRITAPVYKSDAKESLMALLKA